MTILSTETSPVGSAVSADQSFAKTIPLCVPEIAGNEWQYVKECLDANWVSSAGRYVARFERRFAEYVGAGHAVATSSGTAALHLALLAAGVRPSDEVLVSTLTFIAPANAIRYVGAWPVFVDAEPRYFQMDTSKVLTFLADQCERRGGELRNHSTGRRVSAIVPVHILGHPVDMDPLLEAARRYGLAVVEDATESFGARYKGRMVGRLGDIGCFSFNGNKLMTTGGGGMLVSDNESMARRAAYLAGHAKDDPVEYIHKEVGFNYRLGSLQAALGRAQLERVDAFIDAKRRIAARYRAAFSEVPGICPMEVADWAECVHWNYTVRILPERFGMNSRDVMRRLRDEGIETGLIWQPVHLSKAHAASPKAGCPVAEELHATGLRLPSSVGLNNAEQGRVVDALLKLRR